MKTTLTPTSVSGREQEDNTSSLEKIIDRDEYELTTCIKCQYENVHPDDICNQCGFCSDCCWGPSCLTFNNPRKQKKKKIINMDQ